MLEYLVNFFCELCRKSSSQARNTWAKQLSVVGGHLIDNKQSDGCQPWAVLFFELLMHSHGLQDDKDENRVIWSIDDQFEKELRERLKYLRTPSRRNMITPRKNASRIQMMNGKRNMAVRKNLFGSNTTIQETISKLFNEVLVL